MTFISLHVKTRRGVPVNQVQLIDLNDICSPLIGVNNLTDTSFSLSEYKKGPFANFNDAASVETYVVDETLAQIATLAIGYLFAANVLSINGRVLTSSVYMGFNPDLIAGKIATVANGSKFSYQEDGNPDLVTYTVDQTLSQILTAITPTGSGGGGVTYIFSTGLTESSNVITADLSTGKSNQQTAYGGTTAGGSLILTSTTNTTKGLIQFGNSGAFYGFNEATSRLGLGTSTPSDVIGIGGDSGPKSILIERIQTGGSAGANFTLMSGGAAIGSSNNDSGNLILSTGPVTGNGNGNIEFRTRKGVSSGTSDSYPFTQMILLGNGNFGLGTITPTSVLHVVGSVTIVDGTQGAGKILTSDANGLSSWQTVTFPSSGWSLNGNTNGATKYIGTNDNFSFPIYTNGSQRMVVTAAGSVGIGVTNPISTLHIGGSGITIADGSQSNGYILVSDSSGKGSWSNPSLFAWSINGNTVTSVKYIGTNSNFDFPIYTNSTEKARFTTAGRLGINTTSPIAMLDVRSSTVRGVYIEMASGLSTPAMEISSKDSIGISITSQAGGIYIYNNTTSLPAISTMSNGQGVVSDAFDVSGYFTSKYSSAGIFAQNGTLTANNTNAALSVYRNFVLGTFTSVGSVLDINDDTASTGDLFTLTKQTVVKARFKSTGIFQYIDGNQANAKVLTSDANGNATWQTASGGGGSYTFSTGLTNTSNTITANLSTGISGGQTVIGGTAASDSLTLSSTTNATKGLIIFGTSAYNESTNRLGIGTGTVGVPYDLSFGPSAARTIGMNRNVSGGGQSLSINSGSASIGGTNLNAGTLQLLTGIATGNGSGTIEFWASGGVTSGTADVAATMQAKMIGNGNWGIGVNSGGTVSVPAARLDVFSPHGTYVQRWNNSSLSGNIGWSFENQTNSGNTNIIINEHTSVPNTQPRFKFHAGGSFSIGVTATNADANLHVVGTFKLVDTTQGAGKVLTSDANGLASWQTSSGGSTYTGTANRITVTGTVIDISSSYVGQSSITTLGTITTGVWNGSPVTEIYGGTNQTSYTTGDMLYASATNTLSKLSAVSAGSYLRSNGVTTAPIWSTLKLPNSAAVNQVLFATSANNIDSSSEFRYFPTTSGLNVLYVGASQNGSSVFNVDNQNGGTAVFSVMKVTTSSNEFDISLSGPGNSTSANALLISGSSGLAKFDILNASTTVATRFLNGSTESIRISSTGWLSIKTAANATALLDLASNGTTTPQIKFQPGGTLTTTPANGNMEYDGQSLYFTDAVQGRTAVLTGKIVTGTFTPSTTTVVRVNIGGTTYNLVTA